MHFSSLVATAAAATLVAAAPSPNAEAMAWGRPPPPPPRGLQIQLYTNQQCGRSPVIQVPFWRAGCQDVWEDFFWRPAAAKFTGNISSTSNATCTTTVTGYSSFRCHGEALTINATCGVPPPRHNDFRSFKVSVNCGGSNSTTPTSSAPTLPSTSAVSVAPSSSAVVPPKSSAPAPTTPASAAATNTAAATAAASISM